MTLDPGDIVLIPFPYSDLSSTKKRPVVVITAPDRFGDFIAAGVTSVE
jgi:mRNA interferase MazF